MPLSDRLVLLALAVGLAACTRYHWRRGVRGRRLLAVLVTSFYGLALVSMMSAHSAEIAYNTAAGSRAFDGSQFTYNWRTYSLLLFGALLVWQGAVCLATAARLGRGEPAARATILRAAAVVLAVVLPTVPIHAIFGYLISGLSALTLVTVALAARSRGPERPPTAALAPPTA
jgi:hypothetical protein